MTKKNRNALNIDLEKKLTINQKFSERIYSILPLEKGAKALEVGCGGAELSCFLAKDYGWDCIGLEPFPLYSAELGAGKYVRGIAEDIPFKDEVFDIVIAKDVVEHVDDLNKSIDEMLRISRKYVYCVCPNYLFPYEAHFKVPFIPLLPKPFARIFLRLCGFNAEEVDFINHINYITKPVLYSAIRCSSRCKEVLAVVDLQVSKKFRSPGFFVGVVDMFRNSKIEFLIIKK